MPSLSGTIIRGIAGFYFVATVESGIYTCRAKGLFRKENQKPLVGDRVRIELLDEAEKEAALVAIEPRKNALRRPAVANVDQVLLLFALRSPDPDSLLLDRFLIWMEKQRISAGICFNKIDLATPAEALPWEERYAACGYAVYRISADKGIGLEELRMHLQGKTTVVAGPSGAGKSTLTNRLQNAVHMETGALSEKLRRGKNTTRHAELIPLGEGTFLCDTPGFTALELPDLRAEELDRYFPEFSPYRGQCRFPDCSHLQEPDCAVQAALQAGRLSLERYRHYVGFYHELREKEKRRY